MVFDHIVYARVGPFHPMSGCGLLDRLHGEGVPSYRQKGSAGHSQNDRLGVPPNGVRTGTPPRCEGHTDVVVFTLRTRPG